MINQLLKSALDLPMEEVLGSSGRVIDGLIATNIVKPYIQIGESSIDNIETFFKSGDQGQETIHIWSNQRNKTEALSIFRKIKDILHNKSISVNPGEYLKGSIILVTMFWDSESLATHGVVRYSYIMR